jgi:hypothetical protein
MVLTSQGINDYDDDDILLLILQSWVSFIDP